MALEALLNPDDYTTVYLNGRFPYLQTLALRAQWLKPPGEWSVRLRSWLDRMDQGSACVWLSHVGTEDEPVSDIEYVQRAIRRRHKPCVLIFRNAHECFTGLYRRR